jgi:hypothetical protein
MESSVMNKTELDKKVKELDNKTKLKVLQIARQADIQRELDNNTSTRNRARSVTVGTSFGGTTEISMRSDAGNTWCVMNPVEVTELIHQLAANIGCHIAIKPRDDFASWREWRVSEAEKKHLNGHSPFVNDMSMFLQLGASGFNQQAVEAHIKNHLKHKEYEYVNGAAQIKQPQKELKNGKDTVAAKKTVNKRTTKRTARAS